MSGWSSWHVSEKFFRLTVRYHKAAPMLKLRWLRGFNYLVVVRANGGPLYSGVLDGDDALRIATGNPYPLMHSGMQIPTTMQEKTPWV